MMKNAKNLLLDAITDNAMQREIKFRGLRTDGKGWVYGDLMNDYIHHKSGKTIVNGGGCIFIEVIPETVGQLTPYKDVDGEKIFEGDCLGHILNAVEFLDGWSINFDRPLRQFINQKIVGNIHQK